MKSIITCWLLILPLTMTAQELVVSSVPIDKTIGLYKEVNESLSMGNTQKAFDAFNRVIEIVEDEGRSAELPENYLGMALSLALTGHYKESIRYHKKALRAHRKYKSGIASDEITINLGLVYQLAGQMRKSQKVFAKYKTS